MCCLCSANCFGQIEAVTKARHDLRLGFTVPGKVLVRAIHPGDHVKKGDVLIELEDKEGLAQIEIWKFRSQSNVEIDQAKASLELAEIEEGKTRGLVEKHAANAFELKKAELTTAVQQLAVDKAVREQDEAKRQLRITEARHDSYTLRAPIDGVIEQILVDVGEVVENLQPMVELVVTDPLRVDVPVPLAQTMNLKVNGDAWVQMRLDEKLVEPIVGKIVHLANVADSASNTRLVRVEFPNKSNYPAGGQVVVRFDNPDAPLASN
jgi:RND family efflux transporter MFP subunit